MNARTENALYIVLALGALGGTWTFNILHMLEGGTLGDFIRLAFANDAAAAVTADIGITATLLFPWMIREATRYEIKHLWAYLFFGVTIAISVTFPLFLLARKNRIERVGNRTVPSALTAFLPVFAVTGLVMANFFAIRYLIATPSLTSFFADWFATLPSSSLAVDLIFLGATLFVLVISEKRRGNLQHVVPFVAMSVLGLAFAAPLALRALDRHTKHKASLRPAPQDNETPAN